MHARAIKRQSTGTIASQASHRLKHSGDERRLREIATSEIVGSRALGRRAKLGPRGDEAQRRAWAGVWAACGRWILGWPEAGWAASALATPLRHDGRNAGRVTTWPIHSGDVSRKINDCPCSIRTSIRVCSARRSRGRVFIPPNTPRGSPPHSESALARGTPNAFCRAYLLLPILAATPRSAAHCGPLARSRSLPVPSSRVGRDDAFRTTPPRCQGPPLAAASTAAVVALFTSAICAWVQYPEPCARSRRLSRPPRGFLRRREAQNLHTRARKASLPC